MNEKTKVEKGRRSPSSPLNEAIGFLKAIHGNLGDGPFSRESAATALGHQPTSGALDTKIGTLTHFGLLRREANAYRVSDVGKRLLFPTSPEDERAATVEAARSPSVYGPVLRDFDGKSIPELFPNILSQRYGVLHKNAAEVAKLFRQTMEFAGLLKNGVLHDRVVVEETRPATAQEEPRRFTPEPVSTQRVVADEKAARKKYAFAVSKGRTATLTVPLPVTAADVERLHKWIDLMKDVWLEDVADEGE